MMLAAALALTWPGTGSAQVMEEKSFRQDMSVVKKDGRLLTSFAFPEVFTPRFKKRLMSGFTSHILVGMQLSAKGVPLAQGITEFTILYDIWDEKYTLQAVGQTGKQVQVFSSLDNLVQACSKMNETPLVQLVDLPPGVKFKMEVRIQVNPTSPEQLRKIREYLANPDGRGHVGATKFFGSFSRVFVNEQDFQADAIYTYRSPEFGLPSL
jgi:hypothetical protein